MFLNENVQFTFSHGDARKNAFILDWVTSQKLSTKRFKCNFKIQLNAQLDNHNHASLDR